MTSFDLENVVPWSRNFNQKELLCGPTSPPNFGVYSSSGRRDSRGHDIPPPSGRVILRPPPARVLKYAGWKHPARFARSLKAVIVDGEAKHRQ